MLIYNVGVLLVCQYLFLLSFKTFNIILLYSYFEKVVGKIVQPTNPKGNMGYGQYSVPDTAAVFFCYFSLLLTDICPWPLVPFSNFFEEQ